jgi:hypothetical protein
MTKKKVAEEIMWNRKYRQIADQFMAISEFQFSKFPVWFVDVVVLSYCHMTQFTLNSFLVHNTSSNEVDGTIY